MDGGRAVITTGRHGVRLAVDAGQTATKVRVQRPGVAPIDVLHPGVRTNEALLPQLARIAEAVHAEISAPIEVAAFGVSGLTGPDADATILLPLLTASGTQHVILAHDSITSFLGSLGDSRGAVVAAGTGVVTLGVGAHHVARVDGWGNVMGDAGSGYWIGREALEAAMRSYDGRQSATALVDVVRERWSNVEDAYIDLQTDPDRVRVVASFAEAVIALSSTDSTAAQIALRAARELSQSVITALERVADSDDERTEFVSAIGGVFRSDMIRSRFEDLIAGARPEARIEQARGSGLDGVALLPTLAERHPLQGHLSVAVVD